MPARLIDDLITWFKGQGLPASWLIAGDDPSLATALIARGGRSEASGWWAGRVIDAEVLAAPHPSGITIHRVDAEEDLDNWLGVAGRCGWLGHEEDQRTRRELYLAIGLQDAELAHWLAWRNGRAVGMASSFLSGAAVDLCNLAVVENERRRGIGRALATARIRAAYDRDATSVVAALSPDGWRLYRTLGRVGAGRPRSLVLPAPRRSVDRLAAGGRLGMDQTAIRAALGEASKRQRRLGTGPPAVSSARHRPGDLGHPQRPARGSGREVAGEGFLLVGLDRTFAVRGSDPAHGFVWRLAAEDGETGQGGPGAAVAAVAADLDAFTSPGSLEQRFEHGDDQSWVARDAEVGPVQVVVGPRRLPPLVEVQPEVRDHLAGVGLGAAEGHRRHLRAVGEHDTAAVEVRVESAVLVGRVRARSLLGSRVPERPALVAHDDDPTLGHVVITYVAGSVAVPRPAFGDTC